MFTLKHCYLMTRDKTRSFHVKKVAKIHVPCIEKLIPVGTILEVWKRGDDFVTVLDGIPSIILDTASWKLMR